MPIRSLAGLVALASLGVLAADAPEKSFILTIANGAVPKEQRTMRVEKGDAVRVRVKSDAAGELHLHGYRLALRLSPQGAGELEFQAYATGRYPFEWHGAGDAAATRKHHGPPLATLEVRPK
jgi:FtsP/CotA-like multicopper oxidase with cupredoxin domain